MSVGTENRQKNGGIYNLQRKDKTLTSLCYHIVTKLMHSCHRFCGLQPLIIYEDPLYFLAPTPISNLSPSPLHPLKNPKLSFYCSFRCLIYLNEWMILSRFMFFYLILWIYTCRALVPQYQKNLAYYVQQGVKFTVV